METFQRILSDCLSQLRGFPTPHPETTCGFSGGPLRSYMAEKRIGPFSDVKVFRARNFCTVYPNYPTETDDRPFKEYEYPSSTATFSRTTFLIDDKNRPSG